MVDQLAEPPLARFVADELRVTVEGEVDASNCEEFLSFVAEAASAEGQELDLAAVTFMDSSGLRALVRMKSEHSSFEIVGASTAVRRLLELAGMTEDLGLR